MRITESMLQARIDRLNKITGSPMTTYSTIDGRNRANVGNFHLSHANGGVCVHRICNESGACDSPILGHHATKRETFDTLCAFMAGFELAQQTR